MIGSTASAHGTERFSTALSAINLSAALLFLGLGFFGCRTSQPILLTAHISVSDYLALANKVQAGNRGEQSAAIVISYPTLQIFAPDGRLVFQGDNTAQNLALLRQPEIDLSTFSPSASRLRLQDVVSQVGDFRRQGQSLSKSNRYTFLSVSLDGCGSCRVQDDLLEKGGGAAATKQANKLFLVLDP